jgi:hypothetical protein
MVCVEPVDNFVKGSDVGIPLLVPDSGGGW